jgi:hypothetical protein
MEGLMKKTVKQLDVILKNIIGKIDVDINSRIHSYFNTIGNDLTPMKRIIEINRTIRELIDMENNDGLFEYLKSCDIKSIPKYEYSSTKWRETNGTKSEKIKKIIRILDRLHDIASYKQIDCVEEFNGRIIGLIEKNLGDLPRIISEEIPLTIFKFFCLIISIINKK